MADDPHIDEVRDWVGATPDDDAIAAVLHRPAVAGDPDLAALAILRARRADLVTGGPATWAVSGDYSESSAVNLKALDDDIAKLEARTGSTSMQTVGVGRLHRHGRGR